MTRALISVLAAVAVAALLWASFMAWDRGRLQANVQASERRLAVRDRELEDQREAARVLDAHLDRMADERRGLDATLRDLRSREGYDAPLCSDFLRDSFDGL